MRASSRTVVALLLDVAGALDIGQTLGQDAHQRAVDAVDLAADIGHVLAVFGGYALQVRPGGWHVMLPRFGGRPPVGYGRFTWRQQRGKRTLESV